LINRELSYIYISELKVTAFSETWMLFPVWSRRTFSAIIRYLPSRHTHGRFELCSPSWGYTGWRGSENSRRGLVGEIISPLVGRVRVTGRVRVRIGLGVGFGLCL